MKYDLALQMFARVNETLEKNLSKWDGIAALREIYDEFMKNYVKIKKLSEKQIKRPANLINAKNKLLDQLIEKAIPVANVLEVYGSGNNKKRSKPVKISRNKLLKSKDSAIIKKCEQLLSNSRRLYNKALKNIERKTNNPSGTNILGYGLTEGMMNELEDSFNKFKSESGQVRSTLKQEKKITEKIERLVNKNNKLLQQKLDKLMVLFESRDPELYVLYQKSRGFIITEPVKSNTPTPKPKKAQQKRTTGRIKKTSTVKPSVKK